MNLKFLISPEFGFEYLGAWHALNRILQQRSQLGIHLLVPRTANEYEKFITTSRSIDLVYANPSRTMELVREKGYRPFARPRQHFDEMVIVSNVNSRVRKVEDLQAGCRIACTANEDVRLIGLRLLEPANLHTHNTTWVTVDSHENATRSLIRGEVDVAFFSLDAFSSFSRLTRLQLHPIVQSVIHDIYHTLLIHPKRADKLPALQAAFWGLGQQEGDEAILAGIGLPKGFEPLSREDAEFMIDLMDTLRD